MTIKSFVIHEVQRERDKGEVKATYREELDDPKVLTPKLTERLISLFSNASLSLGGFGVDGDFDVEPPYEQYIATYFADKNEDSFLTLTVNMAKKFEAVLNDKSKTTVKGGFLIFYEYEYRAENWLAIAILQMTEGLDIDEALKVIASKTFDLDKLHLGATVNLSRWEAKQGERYIRFKTGLAGELRNYFQDYIGCTRDKKALVIETKILKASIEKYAKEELKVEPDHIQDYLDYAHGYISSKLRADEPVLLSELSNATFSDNPLGFINYINEKQQLGEELSIDRRELRRFEKFSGTWKGINVSFDRKHLGSTVHYNNGQLTITGIPESLTKELEEEIAARKKIQKNE
ncbi:nucleoid-associated protein [Methylobacillus gramineus]|uniref:nucleoid-associated protein n=1 Tax=Methylobacillus gramineus TaxID=755169 RepID=UPI001CFF8A86|nr:nucleoid-associated protein [Methylobacillus gramineus]MCB5184419.1 nucleoid-associated protein [Methylobacillus gramineus]